MTRRGGSDLQFKRFQRYNMDVPETIEFLTRVVKVDHDIITVTDQGLEDPQADIFIVFRQVNDLDWVCSFRGDLIVAKHLDAGYFYAPYVPLTRTPTVLDQSWLPTITHYGKKLLAAAASCHG